MASETERERTKTGCCLRMSEMPVMRPLSAVIGRLAQDGKTKCLFFLLDTRGVEGVDPTLCTAVQSQKFRTRDKRHDVVTIGL